MDKIQAQGTEISLVSNNDNDYLSLTDIAKYKSENETKDIIKNWLRNRNTLEFLGVWEQINNPDFNGVEFDSIKNNSGLNSFTMSPKKWIESTNSIGIINKLGRYGGTYAHPDIAFEFASWISPEFKLYIIQDYQRLKEEESYKQSLEWKTNRFISKLNYSIHTDAIQQYLITPRLEKKQIGFTYANEADLLNMALYGMTAKEWSNKFPNKKGNIRDHSTIEQLMTLNNLQSHNAQMIKDGLPQDERLKKLNQIALEQQEILLKNNPKALQELKKLQ
ncbi:KilA-N domain-containing protein [Vagococcus lutrae]|uniref:KilA-N domain-containing protein n=1 Tax=Vagococcus lutrae TaxID=81947 RepID=UPI00288E844C|nr:KilA-N domain-containing protein [Vagococcus lutrae]MDT2818873.1 KilA-N domain-containing protein [Vagococcus lutrae]MDT2843560.1 KilA-N domain-containing protein [Vagococcus lutrae]